MINLNELENIVDLIKIFVIIIYTYCIEQRIINEKVKNKKKITILILLIIISIVCKVIKNIYGFTYCILCLILLLGLIISKENEKNIGYTILTTTISLSISYMIFLTSVAISFIPNAIFQVNNNFISLLSIIIIYSVLIYLFFKIIALYILLCNKYFE